LRHDFNNLLTGVLGNLDLALHKGVSPERAPPDRQRDPGGRTRARLTSHLLAFGRMQKLSVERCDLNALISGLSDVLGRTLTSAIRVDRELTSGLRPHWRTRQSWSWRSSIWRSMRAMRCHAAAL